MEQKNRGKPTKRNVPDLPYFIRGSRTDSLEVNAESLALREDKVLSPFSKLRFRDVECKMGSIGDGYNGQTWMQFGKPGCYQDAFKKKNYAKFKANNMPSLNKFRRVNLAKAETDVIDLEKMFAGERSTITNQKNATIAKTDRFSWDISNENDSKQKRWINLPKTTTGPTTYPAIPEITKAEYANKSTPFQFHEALRDVTLQHSCSMDSVTDENIEQIIGQISAMKLLFDKIRNDPHPREIKIKLDNCESERKRLAMYEDIFGGINNAGLERVGLNESEKPGTPASMDSEDSEEQDVLENTNSEDDREESPEEYTYRWGDIELESCNIKDQSEVHEKRNLSECEDDTSSDISDSPEGRSPYLSSMVMKEEMDDAAYLEAFDEVTKPTEMLNTTENMATAAKQPSNAPEKVLSRSEIIAKVINRSLSRPETMAKTFKGSPVASEMIKLTKKFPNTPEKMVVTPEQSPVAHDKMTKMSKDLLSTPEIMPNTTTKSLITLEEMTKESKLLLKTSDGVIETPNLPLSASDLIAQLPAMVPLLVEQLPMMADSRVQKKMLKQLRHYPEAVAVIHTLQKLYSLPEMKKASKKYSNITKNISTTKSQNTSKILPGALKDGPNTSKKIWNASVKYVDNYGKCMPKKQPNKLKVNQKTAKDLFPALNQKQNPSIVMIVPKISQKTTSCPKVSKKPCVSKDGPTRTKEMHNLLKVSKKTSNVTSKISNNSRKLPGVEPKTLKDRPYVPQQMPQKLKNNPNLPNKRIGTLKDEPSTSKMVPKSIKKPNAAKRTTLKGTKTSDKGPNAAKKNLSSVNHY